MYHSRISRKLRQWNKISMEGHGVIVKYSQLVDGSREELSCSGMYLGNGIVLSHGTLLTDLLRDKRAEPVIQQLLKEGYSARSRKQPDALNNALKDVQGKCQIILPSRKSASGTVCIECDPCTSSGLKSYNKECSESNSDIHGFGRYVSSQTETDNFLSVAAVIDRVFLQHNVKKCLANLMPASQGWKLIDESQSSISADQVNLIISSFVLLTTCEGEQISLTSDKFDKVVMEAVSDVLSHFIPIQKGNFVFIESSPFGSASPNIFLNSLSHGIICNSSPKSGEILLTDARCIMGSEGAPVFAVVNGQRVPCALVMSPFCWRGGEWLGLTLLASLGPVLQTLLKSYNQSPTSTSTSKTINHPIFGKAPTCKSEHRREFMENNFMEGFPRDISSGVVCIKCGEGWGSGLVISTSPGVILTCAHVVNKAIDKQVVVFLSDGRRLQGKVIHQTSPFITRQDSPRPTPAGHSMWDLAVVTTASPLPHALPLAKSLPPQGAGIIVAGYGMFPQWILPSANLSRGVVSKVVSLPFSSLHVPSHLINSQYHFSTKNSDKGNNSDTSQKSNVTVHCDLSVTSNPKDSHVTSCEVMNLGSPPTGNDKSVPVPVVMQTSCAVYAGGSGGPVVAVHPSQGLEVVGVVVCNMRDSNNITFPDVNLAIPIPTIATILNTFLETGDETVLRYLDVECAAASRLWGLTHPSRSHL